MEKQKLNAIVIGATGAVGREIVDLLMASEDYNKVIMPVRRIINRWENLPPGNKLSIIKVDNLDFLGLSADEIKEKLEIKEQIHVVFNALGSRVGRGEEEFVKVDYTYVVQSAEICEKLSIPHFSLCSAMNADSSSWFLYCKTKGKAEDDIMTKNIERISIMRPGIILNRDNDDRLGEKMIAWVPFVSKIESKDIAKAMVQDDVQFQFGERAERKAEKISNADMLNLAKAYGQSTH